MYKPTLLFLIALPIAMSLANDAGAQASIDEDESSFPRYTAEIIIFSYNQDVSTGSEAFIPDPPPNNSAAFGELTEIEITAPMPAPAEIVLLSESELTMNEIHDRLRRLDVYRPLMHFGWTQTMIPETKTRSQPLSYFGNTPAGLDGDLTLYLSRFLHLDVDLQLAGPNKPPLSRNYSQDGEWSYPTNYRLSEDRIIRNGELRYFDHPKFGVLAKIIRVEEPEDRELLGE